MMPAAPIASVKMIRSDWGCMSSQSCSSGWALPTTMARFCAKGQRLWIRAVKGAKHCFQAKHPRSCREVTRERSCFPQTELWKTKMRGGQGKRSPGRPDAIKMFPAVSMGSRPGQRPGLGSKGQRIKPGLQASECRCQSRLLQRTGRWGRHTASSRTPAPPACQP